MHSDNNTFSALLAGLDGDASVDIEGTDLGRVIAPQYRSSFPQFEKQIVRKTVQSLQKRIKGGTLTPGDLRFASTAPKYFNPALKQVVNSGNFRRKSYSYYKAAQISLGGGRKTFWDEGNTKVVGLSNLNENKIPSGVAFVLTHIQIGYATDASITDAKNVQYETLVAPPKELLNGTITIEGTTHNLLDEVPLSKFFGYEGGAITTSMNPNSLAVPIEDEIFFQKDDYFRVFIEMPDGVTATTGNHFLKITLNGRGITAK